MATHARRLACAEQADDELVLRLKDGDEAAFSELYRRHASYIAGLAYRLLGNDEHLEDVVQETFVIGLGSLAQLRDPGAVRGWLATIAVRRVRRCLAARYRRRKLQAELSAATPAVADAGEREAIHALYLALAGLPDEVRLPWVLHYIEGETLTVVAELCDSSLSSVKRHIAAANRRLQRLSHV